MPRKKRIGSCGIMAGDVKRVADVAAEFADGQRVKGLGLGLGTSRQIIYDISCQRRGKWGPGDCSVYAIERSGPGVEKLGLKTKDTVGNLFGLTKQLSRDLTRIWCGDPGPETGFQGSRKRTKRKRSR